MAFVRIALGWGAVTLLFLLWSEAARRLTPQTPADPSPPKRPDLIPDVTEALLLTLFAGLWFGSLGSGGAWLLFLVVGGLMEVPHRLRQSSMANRWKETGIAVLRIMVAGVVLSFIL